MRRVFIAKPGSDEQRPLSILGGRIVHGMLVLSTAVGLLALDPARVIALRWIRDAVFKAPLAVGEGIRVHSELLQARPLDEGSGLVSFGWRIVGDDGKLRARAVAEVVWSRTAVAEDATAPVIAAADGLAVLV